MYLKTPLVAQTVANRELWFKLECDQPTGSFKLRGMSNLCRHATQQGASCVITSSGGNAGLAVAWSARQLELPCVVVVPQSTPQLTRDRLVSLGASLQVHGTAWDDADSYARDLCREQNGFYAHPFDDALIWDGHASMIHESAADAPRPQAVVVAVGGGGLLCGVLQGMHDVGWHDVPVYAIETDGAASYRLALEAGTPQALPAIESIAITLGARKVAARAVQWAAEHRIQSLLVSDRQAVAACLRFANDQRRLVEPACGAALAAVYEQMIVEEQVLVIVCGGAAVTLGMLAGWAKSFAID